MNCACDFDNAGYLVPCFFHDLWKNIKLAEKVSESVLDDKSNSAAGHDDTDPLQEHINKMDMSFDRLKSAIQSVLSSLQSE